MTPSRQGPIRTIAVERIYEARRLSGKQYLVEQLWPRGLRKEDLTVDGRLRDSPQQRAAVVVRPSSRQVGRVPPPVLR